MTKKQRTLHIAKINEVLSKKCGEPDRWGHYKIGNKRFKMQKTSLRIEAKAGKSWIRLSSAYYSKLKIENLNILLDRI